MDRVRLIILNYSGAASESWALSTEMKVADLDAWLQSPESPFTIITKRKREPREVTLNFMQVSKKTNNHCGTVLAWWRLSTKMTANKLDAWLRAGQHPFKIFLERKDEQIGAK